MTHSPRSLALHRWTVLLIVVSLVVTVAVSLLTVRVVRKSERALISEQTSIFGAALQGYIREMKSGLETAGVVATLRPGAFQQAAGSQDVQGLSALVLLRQDGLVWTPVEVARPATITLTDTASPVVAGLQSVAVGDFKVLGFLSSGTSRAIAFAVRPQAAPQVIVYTELSLGAIAAGTSSQSDVPEDLNFAAYIRGQEQPADLAFATTAKVPLRGTRAVTVISLDPTTPQVTKLDTQPGALSGAANDFLLVASPSGSPLGWLAGNLFWIFLVLGIVAAAVMGGALEMLLRRRDQGLALVEDLEAKNAALDKALADEAEAERQRASLEDQLRQAQRLEAVGQLAGGIAHDFNNLLAVILGNGDFALEALEGHPARQDIEEMLQAAQRAADLTRQLLIFSRRDIVRPTAVDLNQVVLGTNRLLHRTLGEHIELRCGLADDLPPVVADVTGLEQVLMNLAVNARDAMPDGGVLSIATRAMDLDEAYTAGHPGVVPGAYVQLSVGDTGTGMSPEVRSHVFEPFFTTKPVGQGTGMGLATIYAIVTRWGGHISVYSEPGLGSTFKIWLPVMSGEAPAPSKYVEPARLGSRQVILLVEDEEAVRRATRRILERGGYQALEAEDGPSALLALDTGEVDLLLTDVIMPGGVSGKALAERARVRWPNLPILFMSGYTADVIATRGVLERDVALIEKPFTAAALMTAIAEAFAAQVAGVPEPG